MDRRSSLNLPAKRTCLLNNGRTLGGLCPTFAAHRAQVKWWTMPHLRVDYAPPSSGLCPTFGGLCPTFEWTMPHLWGGLCPTFCAVLTLSFQWLAKLFHKVPFGLTYKQEYNSKHQHPPR